MSLPCLNKNKAFIKKVENICSTKFDSQTSQAMKKVTKKDNTYALALIIFMKTGKIILQGTGSGYILHNGKSRLYQLFV